MKEMALSFSQWGKPAIADFDLAEAGAGRRRYGRL
jgi:hypothetical protein